MTSLSEVILWVGVVVLMTTVLNGFAGLHWNEGFTQATIQKKMVDYSKDGSHYLLKTDKGMFEVDRPLLDSFNSDRNADIVFNSIEEGKTYTLHHYGYRIDVIYAYPIVVGVQ